MRSCALLGINGLASDTKRIYKTRELAMADVFDYIEVFYNRVRRHTHLGGVSSEAFELASLCDWGVLCVSGEIHSS